MVAVRGARWHDRWRTGAVLLAIAAALVSALAFVDPARADDAAPVDTPATTGNESSPATDQPADDASAASSEPAAPDPDPAPQPEPPAEPATQEPSSEGDATSDSTEPPAEEPSGPPVTLEPEPPATLGSCAGTGGAEGAPAGACEAAGEDAAPAESPPASCGTTAGEDAAGAATSACAEQEPASPPAAATAPKVAATSAPPAAQPAAPASVLVVSLAPAQSATAPAPAGPVAGVAAEPVANTEGAPVIGSWAIPPAGPVALARTPTPAAKPAETASLRPAESAAGLIAPSLATGSPYLSVAPTSIPIPAATLGSPGARAAPSETDEGHHEVASDAEPLPEPEAVDPFTPFDVHGPGAASGSGGGSPGTATSFRYVAIPATPLSFGYPSAFAYTPAPSSVPEGALEAAPTTRPG